MMMMRIRVSNPPPINMMHSFHCVALWLARRNKRGNPCVEARTEGIKSGRHTTGWRRIAPPEIIPQGPYGAL